MTSLYSSSVEGEHISNPLTKRSLVVSLIMTFSAKYKPRREMLDNTNFYLQQRNERIIIVSSEEGDARQKSPE